MDISGYRPGGRSALMRGATPPPALKRGGAASDRQPSVPLLVKALLVAGLLALAWAGVRRAQHRASGAFGSTHTGDSAPARHVTGQQQRQPDAEAHAGGATAGLFSDGAMVARAERAMRLTPSYRGLGRGGWAGRWGSTGCPPPRPHTCTLVHDPSPPPQICSRDLPLLRQRQPSVAGQSWPPDVLPVRYGRTEGAARGSGAQAALLWYVSCVAGASCVSTCCKTSLLGHAMTSFVMS